MTSPALAEHEETPARARARAAFAVVLALAGEGLVRADRVPRLGIALQVAAAFLFAWGAWPRRAFSGSPAAPGRRPRAARIVAFAAALLGAIAAIVWCLKLYASGREVSAEAPWMAAILLVASAGFLGGPLTAFAPRWNEAPPVDGRARKALYAASIFLILVLAAVVRLPFLDRIPLGINADEGDRAAVSLSILSGHEAPPLFGVGWYHVSIVYFRLLAIVMSIAGETVAGARTFGALAGLVTVGLVLALGTRHFGRRVGLIAGLLVASLGPVLQFSRETTEAGPTATLWAASALLFLEAARGGRAWAWILSGLAGGFSLYFYATGRIWSLFALLFIGALLATAPRAARLKVFAGALLGALAALVVAAPFLYRAWVNPDWFVVRARETSIFVRPNLARLPYLARDWPMPRVLAAQLERSVGIFDRFPDGNYFWPTQQPILPPALAALTILGLFASLFRIRDPRFTLLSVWFWTGFVGVIVTVETPNLQRMATAAPVLALFPALVLDELARRFGDPLKRRAGRAAVIALVAAVSLTLAARELAFYFGPYARLDGWSYPRLEGAAVAREGKDAWVLSLAGQFHMVNSGWVYHLAPDSLRAGILSPGFHLPLTAPANKDLAFLFYAGQDEYRRLVETIYPGGSLHRVPLPPDQWIFDVYRVPRTLWEATQGSLAHAPDGRSVRVRLLGDAPPGAPIPSALRWTAGMRIRRFGNYVFRLDARATRLAVDGHGLFRRSPGDAKGEIPDIPACLARGDHFVDVEGLSGSAAAAPLLSIAEEPGEGTGARATFEPPPPAMLMPLAAPRGLFGVVAFGSGRRQERLDAALATGNLSDEVQFGGESYVALWKGALVAPASGTYTMGLRAAGTATLLVDGREVLRSEGAPEKAVTAELPLAAGAHAVEISFKESIEPARLEWTWIPPGGALSIVPPSALRPPDGSGVAPRCGPAEFGSSERLPPTDHPLTLRW